MVGYLRPSKEPLIPALTTQHAGVATSDVFVVRRSIDVPNGGPGCRKCHVDFLPTPLVSRRFSGVQSFSIPFNFRRLWIRHFERAFMLQTPSLPRENSGSTRLERPHHVIRQELRLVEECAE
jgi:hypothetical protein